MQTSEDVSMLLELKKGNNLKAYQYFFMKYYKPLCLKAYQMLGNTDRARETVQQLFIEVWRKGAYMDIQQSAGGYFYQLVHQQCQQILAADAGNSDRHPEQCPPCQTGPALVPQALRPQFILAIENKEQKKLTVRYSNI